MGCDECSNWYHLLCLGLKRSPPKKKTWSCPSCKVSSSYTVIETEGDGRCLFRSVVTALNPQLQVVERDQHGRILDWNSRVQETLMADDIRNQAVQYLVTHQDEYHHLEGEGVNADLPDNVRYTSLMHRMEAMMQPTTMAGELEISALSKACSVQIVVHSTSNVVHGNEFENVVHIKFTQISGAVGHYECLIPK